MKTSKNSLVLYGTILIMRPIYNPYRVVCLKPTLAAGIGRGSK